MLNLIKQKWAVKNGVTASIFYWLRVSGGDEEAFDQIEPFSNFPCWPIKCVEIFFSKLKSIKCNLFNVVVRQIRFLLFGLKIWNQFLSKNLLGNHDSSLWVSQKSNTLFWKINRNSHFLLVCNPIPFWIVSFFKDFKIKKSICLFQ